MIDGDVKVRPDPDHVASLLSHLGRKLGNAREPLTKSADVLTHSAEQNFATAGRGLWAPLDPQTAERKARDGLPPVPLIRSGRLLRAVGAHARWTVRVQDADFGHLPVSLDYGLFHQFGTDHMPARPWATVYPDDEHEIEDIFGLWVQDTMRGALAAWR